MKKRGHPTEDKIDEEGDHEVSWWAGRGLAQGRLWGIPPSSCSEPNSRTFAGHSTALCRQEKSHHQQGTGMRSLTLQAAPSGDTVGSPGPHPHPGLPLCWQELQAGLAEEHRGQSGCQRVPSRASLTSPPAPCAGGTSPP